MHGTVPSNGLHPAPLNHALQFISSRLVSLDYQVSMVGYPLYGDVRKSYSEQNHWQTLQSRRRHVVVLAPAVPVVVTILSSSSTRLSMTSVLPLPSWLGLPGAPGCFSPDDDAALRMGSSGVPLPSNPGATRLSASRRRCSFSSSRDRRSPSRRAT